MPKPPRLIIRAGNLDDPAIAEQVADRELTLGVVGVLQDLVLSLCDRWDQPPMCGPLYLRSRTPMVPGQLIAGLAVEWEPFPEITPLLIKARRQHHVLVTLAERFQADAHDFEMPAEMIAMVLINEAWMTNIPYEDKEAVERLKAAARARKLHEQPERMEVKQALAVDVNGTIYMVQKQRGGKSLYMAGPYGTDQAIGGDVPDGLEYLMYSFMGRTMPDWATWQDKERPERSGPPDLG